MATMASNSCSRLFQGPLYFAVFTEQPLQDFKCLSESLMPLSRLLKRRY